MKWQSFKCHSNLAIHVFCSYTTSFPFPPPIPLQKEIYFRYSKKTPLGPSFFQLKCVMEVWRHNIVRKCIQFNPCKCLNIVMGSWEIQLISLLISDTYNYGNRIRNLFSPFLKTFFFVSGWDRDMWSFRGKSLHIKTIIKLYCFEAWARWMIKFSFFYFSFVFIGNFASNSSVQQRIRGKIFKTHQLRRWSALSAKHR